LQDFDILNNFSTEKPEEKLIKEQSSQNQMEFVTIEDLVPEDHLLRKIDKYIDFRFIREKTKELYCQNNGRPSIDPVVLFKILMIGYLFGIRSERRLLREIEVNLAYRWFIGYGIQEKVPHHSTLSQNRRRRFSESGVYEEIFSEIVYQAIKHKMLEGKVLYTDSTHLKANANKGKFRKRTVKKTVKQYISELDKDIETDRKSNGKQSLKKKS